MTPRETQQYLTDKMLEIEEAISEGLPSSSGLTMEQIRDGIIAGLTVINDSQKELQSNTPNDMTPLFRMACATVNQYPHMDFVIPKRG